MLIVTSGKARSGKDTFAKLLADEMFNQKKGSYIMMAYATLLKNKVQEDFDLTYDQLWGDQKEVKLEQYPKPDDDGYFTPREILQQYGQFFRTIDPNYWIDALLDTIKRGGYENIIVTDARHKNEIDAIKDIGGIHIKVVRDTSDYVVHGQDHISENDLNDDYKVDFKINNSGTIEDLTKSVKDVITMASKITN